VREEEREKKREGGCAWGRFNLNVGCLIFVSNFPQKSHVISSSFVKSNLQLKASMYLRHPVVRCNIRTHCSKIYTHCSKI